MLSESIILALCFLESRYICPLIYDLLKTIAGSKELTENRGHGSSFINNIKGCGVSK